MQSNYLDNQRGVALIAALSISVILFLAIMTFGYRAGVFTKSIRGEEVRSQQFYLDDMYLELLRAYLWDNDCAPPGWCSADFTALDSDAYYDVTSAILAGVLGNTDIVMTVPPAPATPQRKITLKYDTGDMVVTDLTVSPEREIDRYSPRVYLKTTSVPKVLEVMISAEQSSQQGKGIIEAAVIFALSCPQDYEQFGGCASKEGKTDEGINPAAVRN